jgi:hypothetical protein
MPRSWPLSTERRKYEARRVGLPARSSDAGMVHAESGFAHDLRRDVYPRAMVGVRLCVMRLTVGNQ